MNRYRPNKFRAKPEGHAGPTMGGVHSHPGFHTTGTMEVAACYAQAHAVPHFDVSLDEPIYDYPVIVTIDMAGLVPLADYDAERQLWPDVLSVLNEFFRMNPAAGLNELRSWLRVDFSDGREELARGDSAADALFRIASWRIEDPYNALLSLIESHPNHRALMMELRAYGEGRGKPDDAFLCALADQYRYLEDVDEKRIVAVSHMKPYWPSLLDYQQDDSDTELAEKLESAGWSVLDVEDLYSATARVETAEVYKARRKPRRLEYHGTTYRNLLSAAPRLGKKLPVPPPPFQRES